MLLLFVHFVVLDKLVDGDTVCSIRLAFFSLGRINF